MNKKEIFSAEFDFYTELLTWTFDSGSLSDALVNEAWDLYKDYEEDEKLYRERKDLAGERYIAEIELDGAIVGVSILDKYPGRLQSKTEEEQGYTEEEQGYLDELERLTHIDMARLWRFAPAGHHFFGGNAVATEAFNKKWHALGGMIAKMSKAIGWDENRADNRRVIDGD